MNILLLSIPRKANLSHQYYCLGLYEYLQREQLKEKWRALLDQPPSDQLLIQGNFYLSNTIYMCIHLPTKIVMLFHKYKFMN